MRWTIFQQGRINGLLQGIEHIRVAEEAGNVNEDVLVERLRLPAVLTHIVDVLA